MRRRVHAISLAMQAAAKPDLETTLERGAFRLHVEHYAPSTDPRLAVVMVHGFSAHCGLYRHVGRALAAQGIAVTQYDARGHGRSDGRRGHIDRFDDYLDDLEAIVAWARERHPTVPWALVGHSMGAAVCALLVLDEKRTLKPSRMAMLAPWLKLKMKVSPPKRAAANVLAKVLPTLSMNNGLRAKNVSSNPEVHKSFGKDPLIHHVASAGWFMEALRAQARIRVSAEKLLVPTLMVLAGEDRIVVNETNRTFAEHAGTAVTVREVPGLFHEIFLETGADAVIADLATWLLGA